MKMIVKNNAPVKGHAQGEDLDLCVTLFQTHFTVTLRRGYNMFYTIMMLII